MPDTDTLPVAIVATLDVLPGQRDDVIAALREAVSASREEPGCEFYVLHEVPAQPDRLVMLERWASPAALQRHLQAPAFQQLAARLQGRAELGVMELRPLS